jgi:hypothetical protein
MAGKFSELLAHVTGGRRYGFVIMSYQQGYSLFERIRAIVTEETGFECIRADDVPGAGEDLRSKIHAAIDNCALVIADVSHISPNIYYEVGYAVAGHRPLLLLARSDASIPTDLLGVELIRYADNRDGLARFEVALRQHLAVHRDSNVSLLRAMILPLNPRPSYILVSPKPVTAESHSQFHPHERRTYGDYLGVIGVLGAFASVYGEQNAPELITASRAPKELETWDANLYLLGSGKVNQFTTMFLNALQRGRAPGWTLLARKGAELQEDYEVDLRGVVAGRAFTSCESTQTEEHRVNVERDYGLIVRGPHPRYPERMVTVMAGPHSLGTGAACLAATRSDLVRQIARRLTGTLDLTTRDKTMWVLVRGVVAADSHIDAEGVEVVDAGLYA